MSEFKDLPKSRVTDILNRAFSFKNKFCTQNGCVLPKGYREIKDLVENFKVRSDDVFICSYPRTGSTWLAEISWLLRNNLDYDKARSSVFYARYPLIEFSCLFNDRLDKRWIVDQLITKTKSKNWVDFVDQMERPRIIKTHLPWDMLPKQLKDNPDTKIIYTMRNPKDTMVSYYHFCLLIYQIDCSFDDFIEILLSNGMLYGPLSQHMIEFYKRCQQPNILLVKYEDMKRDLPSVIRQCADHLQISRTLTTDDIERLCDHVKFEKMETNPSTNLEPAVFADPFRKEQINHEVYKKIKFIRKGQIGDWQNYFSPELNERVDKWIEENLTPIGLTFDYV